MDFNLATLLVPLIQNNDKKNEDKYLLIKASLGLYLFK